MEMLIEDISFNAGGDHPLIKVKIDKNYVLEKLGKTLSKRNLKKVTLFNAKEAI